MINVPPNLSNIFLPWRSLHPHGLLSELIKIMSSTFDLILFQPYDGCKVFESPSKNPATKIACLTLVSSFYKMEATLQY
jgi:hypothetical protein